MRRECIQLLKFNASQVSLELLSTSKELMTWKKTWRKSQETEEEDRKGCQRQEQHLSITALSLTHESSDKKSDS